MPSRGRLYVQSITFWPSETHLETNGSGKVKFRKGTFGRFLINGIQLVEINRLLAIDDVETSGQVSNRHTPALVGIKWLPYPGFRLMDNGNLLKVIQQPH
jgi:hypothetical protein